MQQPPTVQELIDLVKQERTTWEAVLEQINEQMMTQPGVSGEWSLKDVIAHITWHENEMVGMINAHALEGSDLWNLITDERNAIIHEENRDKSLAEVLDESKQVYLLLMDLLPTMSDDDLTNPENFTGMPPDWQPWTIIADNTYEHYQHHIADIKRWLAE
jgi:hypothetical protein